MKKALALLVLAALAALLWTQWLRQDAPARPATNQPAAPVPASGHTAAAKPGAMNERVPVGPPAPGETATTGTLHVRVLWSDGSPGGGVRLTIEPTLGDAFPLEAVTGSDGTATVTDLTPGDGLVRLDWRQGEKFAITAGQTTECEIKVPPGVDVHGIVVDEEGQPVPTARIWLSTFRGGDEGQDCGPVNTDGTFVVRSVPPSPQRFFLAATAPGKRTSTLTRVAGKAGETQDVRIELRYPGVALIGRVFLPDGRPAAGARVLVGIRAVTNAWDQERFTREYRPPVDTRCDERGSFRADGLSPGSSVQVWLRHEAAAPRLQSVQLLTDRDLVVQFDLFVGATIHGQVTDAAAEPVGGLAVTARSDALFDLHRGDGFFFGPQWAHSSATAAADGSYEIAHVAAGRVRLDVAQTEPRRSAATTLPVKDKETVTWDAVLTAGATIQGHVVTEQGVALAGWSVHASNLATGRDALTDARGHFELADCDDGPWRVSARSPDAFAKVPAAVKVGVRAGTTDLRLVVPLRAIPDATMVGKLRLADGSVPPKAGISYWREGGLAIDTVPVDKDGSFRIGLLPAATYRVRALFEHTRGPWTDAFALRQGETLDLGTLQAPATGSVIATVRDAAGKLLDGVECQIVESLEGLDTAFAGGRTKAGTARIDGLAPGDYRLRITGRDQPVVNAPFTIAEGKETAVDVTVPDSVACMLHLQPPSEGAPLQIAFTWSRDGTVFLQHSDWWRANSELVLPRRLVPGDYDIAIASETGKREVNRFTVRAGDADGKEIAIKLP